MAETSRAGTQEQEDEEQLKTVTVLTKMLLEGKRALCDRIKGKLWGSGIQSKQPKTSILSAA